MGEVVAYYHHLWELLLEAYSPFHIVYLNPADRPRLYSPPPLPLQQEIQLEAGVIVVVGLRVDSNLHPQRQDVRLVFMGVTTLSVITRKLSV